MSPEPRASDVVDDAEPAPLGELNSELAPKLEAIRTTIKADTIAVLLYDAPRQFLVATAARGIEEEVRQGSRVPTGIGFAGRIARTAAPLVLPSVTPANVVNPLLLNRGISSMLGVPLLQDDTVIGVMHIGSLEPRTFQTADIVEMQRAAHTVVAAIVDYRARADTEAATELIRSLTSRLPEIENLDLAARHVAVSHHGVGGCWYDAFRLADERVGVVVGHVRGAGLSAAVEMGRIRASLRSYALIERDPGRVLGLLDRKVQHFDTTTHCTVLYGILDPRDGRLAIASAGHPYAVVSPRGMRATRLAVPVAAPLGVGDPVDRDTTDVTLRRGSRLVLFTNGLLHRSEHEGNQDPDSLLLDTLSNLPTVDAESLCAYVMASMQPHADARSYPDDDISLLVVRRT